MARASREAPAVVALSIGGSWFNFFSMGVGSFFSFFSFFWWAFLQGFEYLWSLFFRMGVWFGLVWFGVLEFWSLKDF